ncbi:MAG: DUF3857 domain-containing protein [Thermoanaerobaculia bacterium]
MVKSAPQLRREMIRSLSPSGDVMHLSRRTGSSRLVRASLLAPVALAGLLTAQAAPPEAAEPWAGEPFAADPAAVARAAAQVQGKEGEDVVVLLTEASYTFDDAGREVYRQRLVYKILAAGADESWSTVEEGWEPWHQSRPEMRARVITPDGAEHLLDPATLAENGAAEDRPDMFEDGRVLRGPLPATRPGAVIEQQVIVRDKAPFFDGGVVRLHGFDPGVPVRRARLALEAPEALPLRWVVREVPGVSPREVVSGGRRRLTFEARDLSPLDDPEPGLPPDVPRSAYVAFSTGRSWADLARRYSDIVDRAVAGADLAAFLRAAGGPAPSEMETIQRLLARVSDEVRYTGVELGEGGLIPRKPAETLRRKFGDCKDKAALLTALLRASDIPAYVALLNAGEDAQDVEESLPGFGLFNHAIVVVPGSPAIWIDPTDPYARAGELPVGDQGRLALIASPTATGLTRTPEATAADNREVESREFYLADLGPARVVESSELWGAQERDLRGFYALQDGPGVRQALQRYASSVYLSEEVGVPDYSKPADLSGPLKLRFEARNARRGFTDERNAAVGVNAAALLNRLPDEVTAGAGEDEEDADDPRPRRGDFVFTRPTSLEVRYRIVPPAGFAPQPLPASRERKIGSVTLAEEYAAAPDGVVTAVFRLDTGKRRLSAQELEALRSGVREALREKTTLLLFDQAGEAHLAAGRVREALAEFQRLAALSPRKALPRLRIARGLLAGGMGEAAREEARRAVQLEPKLAVAHRDLGWILQHDELGRRFGPGFDRAGAVAAYRKARELDPKDLVARQDLAILLEHDGQGRRYSPKADLAAAIDEYRAARKDLGAEGFDESLLIALVRAGRLAEARELAGKMERSETSAVLALVATAATEGADAAVREADRRVGDDGSRATALQSAAQNLLVLRRYPEAATLFDRASRQSPNAAALLSLADLLRRAKPYEQVPLPAGEPASVVKRMMVALFTADSLDLKLFASLFAREIEPEVLSAGDAAGRTIAAQLAPVRRKLREQNLPEDVTLDLILASLREAVSGDDASGYRVSLAAAMGSQSSPDLRVYVVRQEGEYRIAGLSTAPDMLADEALRRLARNDLAGARRWLDWTAEEKRPAADPDPLAADPFSTLWTRGAEAGADAIRCAAGALKSDGGEAIPILLACREAADPADTARRNALDLALAMAYQKAGKMADLEEASRRLLAAVPGSDRAEGMRLQALIALGRWDEVRAAAESRLQRTADDGLALRVLAGADIHARDLEKAEQRYLQLTRAGKADAGDFNQLAWMLLEHGRVDEATIDYGQRAASLSNYGVAAHLHTLAAIYAETGKAAEAYRVILQSLAARPDEAPSADDWYIFGRLAESYGLPDVARKYYKRIPPPPSPEAELLSTHALAARRLAALGEARKPGQASP